MHEINEKCLELMSGLKETQGKLEETVSNHVVHTNEILAGMEKRLLASDEKEAKRLRLFIEKIPELSIKMNLIIFIGTVIIAAIIGELVARRWLF